MTLNRPLLDASLPAEEFLRWYWLKEELIAFCRQQQLTTSGGKQAISARIATWLSTGQKSRPAAAKTAPKARMPSVFTRETVIGPGWACSQPLRAFLEHEIGPAFHFDAVMRNYIHQQPGQTLGAAIAAWQAAQANPTQREIAPQFEYNRHIREYMQTHPGARLAEAIAAWKERRQKPGDL